MKKLITILFILFVTASFAQVIKIDSISIVKPDAKHEILEQSLIENLEVFNDAHDAVVYIYRLKSMVGAAVKWKISVNDGAQVKLKQKEYFVVHLDTRIKGHFFYFPDMRYNYTNFKPNTYYYIMLKGFKMETGYMDAKRIDQLNTCRLSKSITD